jgi:hypothetical protein
MKGRFMIRVSFFRFWNLPSSLPFGCGLFYTIFFPFSSICPKRRPEKREKIPGCGERCVSGHPGYSRNSA